MPRQLSRSSFLATGAAFVLAPTSSADAPPDIDLANARLLVAIELLLADFYRRALKADRFGAAGRDAFGRALFNETEHLAAVSKILTGAGQTPAASGDIDFSYPAAAFASRRGVAHLGMKLERLALGAYLGAVASVQSQALKVPLAQIAACEARHLTVLSGDATGHGLDESFGDPIPIDEASNALGEYTS